MKKMKIDKLFPFSLSLMLIINVFFLSADTAAIMTDFEVFRKNQAKPPGWDAHQIMTDYEHSAYIKAYNVSAGDEFSKAIDLAGNTLVVGSPMDNNDGIAFVFIRIDDSWTQLDVLSADNGDYGDQFGASVAISEDGDTIVIGAPYEDSDGSSPSDNSELGAGAAYVFERSGAIWNPGGYLKASNPDPEDAFGTSVAISEDGNRIVVGAPNEDNFEVDSGAIYVFGRSGDTWTEEAYLKAANPDISDAFGRSVSISGDTVVVGAPNEDGNGTDPFDNSLSNSGAVYIFVGSGSSWPQVAYLKAENAEERDHFGNTLDISVDGERIVVAAVLEDGDGTDEGDNSKDNAGAAYVFENNLGVYTQAGYLKASNADDVDNFGTSVAISGDTIAVGAMGEDGDGSHPENNNIRNSGAAYTFEQSGTEWVQTDYIKAANPDESDWFGFSVAISDEMVIVGAPQEDSDGSDPGNNSEEDSGAVYVFDKSFSLYLPLILR